MSTHNALVDENLLSSLEKIRSEAANWDELPEWCREGIVDGIAFGKEGRLITEARLTHIGASLRCAESRARIMITDEMLDECQDAVDSDWYMRNPDWAKECLEQILAADQELGEETDDNPVITRGQLKQIEAALKCNHAVNRKSEVELGGPGHEQRRPGGYDGGYKPARKQHGRVNKKEVRA